MPRPHIEFVQTQNIDWQEQPDGSATKLLNADPESGEATLLVRYPPGYGSGAMATEDGAEEYFVLDGAIAVDGTERRRHFYGFLPRAAGKGARQTRAGATLLVFRHGRQDADSLAG